MTVEGDIRPAARSERSRALAAMLVASVLFALMGASTKLASRTAPGLPRLAGGEIALFRYLFGLAFLLIVGKARGVSLLGYDRAGLMWRGLYGGIASTCFFLGLQLTSLTNATLLNYTLVIWGPLIASITLNEKLGRRGALAVLTAFLGVFLVVRPGPGGSRVGDVIALVSGFMAGAAVVQIRKLRQGESAFAIFFYFNLLGVPVSLFALPLSGERLVWPIAAQVPLILAVGATSVAAQLLMTYGYRELTAAQGSLISLMTVLYAALLAWVLFADPPGWHTAAGGALILGSAAAITFGNARKRAAE